MKLVSFIAGFFTMALFALTSTGKDFLSKVENHVTEFKTSSYCKVYNSSPEFSKEYFNPSTMDKFKCKSRSISSKTKDLFD